MNSLDNPVFGDINYVDDLWLTKDLNSGDRPPSPSMDVDIFCVCNEDKMIYSRKSSEAMNIPQVSSYYTKEAETWDSSALLDTDVNFYDHSFIERKCTSLLDLNEEESNHMSLWGNPIDMDSLKLEEIFQVEEAEAIQGPTLAQLNSKNEPMFEDMNFSDTFCEEMKLSIVDNYLSKSRTEPISDLVENTSEAKVPVVNTNEILQGTTPPAKTNKVTICIPTFSPNCSLPSNIDNKITNTVQMNTAASLPVSTHLTVTAFNKHQLLPEGNFNSKSETFGLATGPISCSAPTESMNDLATKLQLTKEISTRRRNNSSTDRSVCSVSSLSLSNDESFDSSRDGFGLNEDASSNSDSGDAAEKYVFTSWFPRTESKQKPIENKKKKRYFWQYNIQSKGPKGPKIPLDQSRLVDPHRLSDARDPVFSTKCYLEGVKHSGKARRGDGNDLTPNPQKLYSIGLELKKLNKVINDLEPTIDQPFNIRPKSRREKNKLASRVCRLKKKAQHEANKLKLYGLQKEHSNMLSAIEEVRQLFKEKLGNVDLTTDVEKLVASNECIKVAGCTTEFVNSILEKVSEGDFTGGLNDI